MNNSNLSAEILACLNQSEQDGGLVWKDIPVGTTVVAKTRNSVYLIEKREDGDFAYVSGGFFTEPEKVRLNGSTWGGSMIKVGFIGVGMYIEFVRDSAEKPMVTTTAIRELGTFRKQS